MRISDWSSDVCSSDLLDVLRSNNLGLGASLDNVVALDDFRVVNHDGLRYDDEFVRHKILDAVGDLYLLGHAVIGAYTAYKRSEEHTSELQSLMRISYAVFCLKKKTTHI